jgi:hypothetical protein
MPRRLFNTILSASIFLSFLFAFSIGLEACLAAETDSDAAPLIPPYRAAAPSIFSLDNVTWTVGADMPTARYSGATGTYGDEIFVAMGRISDSLPFNTAVVEAYNYTANTWRTNLQAGPTARRTVAFGAMYQDSLLFVIGGRDNNGNILGNNEIYNMATNAWRTGAPCQPRWAHGGAVLDGYAYIFGSSGTPTPNTSSQRYNIATDAWTSIADMPLGDGGVCGAAAAHKVYAVGGSANGTAMRDYDPASNTWTTRAPIPHTRTHSTAVGINGLVYVVGGDGAGNSVDVFDPTTNTWSSETSLPGNISWSQMGVSNNAIYVIGGTPQFYPVQYQRQTWIGSLIPQEYGNLDGTVAELAGGIPIEDSWVVLNGDSTLTNVAGLYEFTDVQVGTYNVRASMLGYNSQTESVEILVGQTVTQDFQLTQPLICTDIDSINIDLSAGESYQEDFNISNMGNGELSYNITITQTGYWLAVNPVSGTILPGESDAITASFTIPGSANPGEQFTASIVIHNNSVLNPITIAVTVTIVLGVEENGHVSPMAFTLHQNYPNPFNPSTDIRFDLPQTSRVTLDIYDVMGQKVASLVHQNMEAGSHQVTFNGSGLASGVYFYRISAGSFTDMKKMVLMK